MEILGVIPARGGSKGIPRKNLAPLAGRPLLSHTCTAALASARLSRVVLDTDDPEIAACGRSCGVEVPFLRPAELAADDTLILDALSYLLGRLKAVLAYEPDAITLLQPTSPLRTSHHIDGAIQVMLDGAADTVVTVMSVPHHFNPASLMRLSPDGRLEPYVEGPVVTRRQDKPVVYARNGPAVLVTRREVIKSGRLYGERVLPFHMAAAESVDIDGPEDLALAELWIARRQGAVRVRGGSGK